MLQNSCSIGYIYTPQLRNGFIFNTSTTCIVAVASLKVKNRTVVLAREFVIISSYTVQPAVSSTSDEDIGVLLESRNPIKIDSD